ncbi:MAG TPA: Bax inhibitor-1 family protein [Vicinamibacterales bacterium]|nr:Bax inhibitor-1 family protein [Vicinamibacterales bacterium]
MRSYDATPGDGYQQAIADEASAFLRAVYGWMCAGLTITAATAWSVAASSRAIEVLAGNRLLFLGLFLAQLGIVFILSASVQRLAASTLIRGRATSRAPSP